MTYIPAESLREMEQMDEETLIVFQPYRNSIVEVRPIKMKRIFGSLPSVAIPDNKKQCIGAVSLLAALYQDPESGLQERRAAWNCNFAAYGKIMARNRR